MMDALGVRLYFGHDRSGCAGADDTDAATQPLLSGVVDGFATPGSCDPEGTRAMHLPRAASALPLVLTVTLLPVPLMPAVQTVNGTASLNGSVADADGNPAGGVCIEVDDVLTGTVVEAVATGEDGSWSTSSLGPGEYSVGANTCLDARPGLVGTWWPGVAAAGEAEPVELQSGETRSLSFVLPDAGTIAGSVQEAGSGTPLEGACVVATDVSTGVTAAGRSDTSGRYAIANLPDGEYGVLFDDCSEPKQHLAEVYPDVAATASDTAAVQRVAVQAGGTTDGIDASLAASGYLVGAVTAVHTGRPAAGVCLGAYSPDAEDASSSGVSGVSSGLSQSSSPDAGRVLIPYLDGDFTVLVNDPGCSDDGYTSTWVGGTERADATRFSVAAGEAEQLPPITVQAAPSILKACGIPQDQEGTGFSDVHASNVHFDAIRCARERDIARGASGAYHPEGSVRRDQMASFTSRLLLAAGFALPESPPDAFWDDNGNLHETAINQLQAVGVVGGTGGGRFSPDALVSRGQMATFLVNSYQAVARFELVSSGNRFTDDDGSTHEARINKAVTAGFTAGVSPTSYAPGAMVRRDQMASFLVRTLDRLVRDAVPEAAARPQDAGAATTSLNGAPVRLQHHAPAYWTQGGVTWRTTTHARTFTALEWYYRKFVCTRSRINGKLGRLDLYPRGKYRSWFWCSYPTGGVGF